MGGSHNPGEVQGFGSRDLALGGGIECALRSMGQDRGAGRGHWVGALGSRCSLGMNVNEPQRDPGSEGCASALSGNVRAAGHELPGGLII